MLDWFVLLIFSQMKRTISNMFTRSESGEVISTPPLSPSWVLLCPPTTSRWSPLTSVPELIGLFPPPARRCNGSWGLPIFTDSSSEKKHGYVFPCFLSSWLSQGCGVRPGSSVCFPLLEGILFLVRVQSSSLSQPHPTNGQSGQFSQELKTGVHCLEPILPE